MMQESEQTASDVTTVPEMSLDATTATCESYAKSRREAARPWYGPDIVEAYNQGRQGTYTTEDWTKLRTHLTDLAAHHENQLLEGVMKTGFMHAIFFVCMNEFMISDQVYAEVLGSFEKERGKVGPYGRDDWKK